MIPTRNINIKYLHQYSISKEGNVFCGDKEIKGIWSDEVTYQFSLYPSNHKMFPVAFKLEDLYRATFGKKLPQAIKQSKKLKQNTGSSFREIVLTDPNNQKLSFPNISYASTFLGIKESSLMNHIKRQTNVGGFKITAIDGSRLNNTHK